MNKIYLPILTIIKLVTDANKQHSNSYTLAVIQIIIDKKGDRMKERGLFAKFSDCYLIV